MQVLVLKISLLIVPVHTQFVLCLSAFSPSLSSLDLKSTTFSGISQNLSLKAENDNLNYVMALSLVLDLKRSKRARLCGCVRGPECAAV